VIFRWRRPRPPDPSRFAEDRILAAMTYCRSMQGTGHLKVPVAQVMILLDPQHKMHPEPDPRQDPVTGCLPVTAEPGPRGTSGS